MIKVLLVDDETEFSSYMSKRLSKRGMTVDTTDSGEKAIGVVKEKHFDVIVLDMLMPGMDGNETLIEIKKIKPEIEVIMLTGHGTIKSAVEGVKTGAFDYLLKPADFEELTETIEKAFDKKLDNEEKKMEERISLALQSPRGSVKLHDDE